MHVHQQCWPQRTSWEASSEARGEICVSDPPLTQQGPRQPVQTTDHSPGPLHWAGSASAGATGCAAAGRCGVPVRRAGGGWRPGWRRGGRARVPGAKGRCAPSGAPCPCPCPGGRYVRVYARRAVAGLAGRGCSDLTRGGAGKGRAGRHPSFAGGGPTATTWWQSWGQLLRLWQDGKAITEAITKAITKANDVLGTAPEATPLGPRAGHVRLLAAPNPRGATQQTLARRRSSPAQRSSVGNNAAAPTPVSAASATRLGWGGVKVGVEVGEVGYAIRLSVDIGQQHPLLQPEENPPATAAGSAV